MKMMNKMMTLKIYKMTLMMKILMMISMMKCKMMKVNRMKRLIQCHRSKNQINLAVSPKTKDPKINSLTISLNKINKINKTSKNIRATTISKTIGLSSIRINPNTIKTTNPTITINHSIKKIKEATKTISLTSIRTTNMEENPSKKVENPSRKVENPSMERKIDLGIFKFMNHIIYIFDLI